MLMLNDADFLACIYMLSALLVYSVLVLSQLLKRHVNRIYLRQQTVSIMIQV